MWDRKCLLVMDLSGYFHLLSAACGALMAAAVLVWGPRSISAGTFAIGMLALSVECASYAWIGSTLASPHGSFRTDGALLMLAISPAPWLLFSLHYARGEPRSRSGSLIWTVFVLLVASAVFVLVRRWTIGETRGVSLRIAQWPVYFIHLSAAMAGVCVLVNLERTYRAAMGITRWRIKYLLLGVGILFAARLFTSSQFLLFQRLDFPTVHAGALLVACILIPVSLWRTRRFEPSLYPSQSLLKGSISLILIGGYFIAVGLIAKAVKALGHDLALDVQALFFLAALGLLGALLLSERMRLRLSAFVSRHFRRPVHDYREIWKRFNDVTASRVEIIDLSRGFVALIAELFRVLSVSLWVLEESRANLRMAASTSLSQDQAGSLELSGSELRCVLERMNAEPGLIDFERAHSTWAVALRRLHPSVFPQGGDRVALPLRAHGELVGVLLVGDRVAGSTAMNQDRELLERVGEHIAASLLNSKLSNRLAESREFAAFQTMAAFFVHDLKNAASTVNLTLQNLPQHFSDPLFREDALRGVRRTVEHINRLVDRFNRLREGEGSPREDIELNTFVRRFLSGFNVPKTLTLQRDLNSACVVTLDTVQMSTVLSNLLLNACDAMNSTGLLRVSTGSEKDWALLTVHDTGCGMSAEFLRRSLFRPFQTTKKTGFGIGMFQSKMIIENHGGRITVSSTPGGGTTFKVYLPAARCEPPSQQVMPVMPTHDVQRRRSVIPSGSAA